MADTATATISVLSITPVRAGRLLALADVLLVLDGVEIAVHGIQVVADARRTEILLPKFRSPSGAWQTAITLPDETKDAIGGLVIGTALDAGILREKSAG